jgi:hypothetical protein
LNALVQNASSGHKAGARGRAPCYRGGRCTHWIKVKNPASLAMNRAAEIDWSR